MGKKFKFDFALSFAGEDRKYADDLATRLKKQGVSVFYDRDYQSYLLGKKQSEYELIYGLQSRFVVPIISQNYVKKDWPRFEFDSAKREAPRRNSEFILPLRLDDARLLGLNDDLNFLSLIDLPIESVAAALLDKLPSKASGSKKSSQAVTVLQSEQRKALGLLAVSFVPVPISIAKLVFPDIAWESHVRALKKANVLKTERTLLCPDKSVVDVFIQDETECESLRKDWVLALESLQGHPLTNWLLAGTYLFRREFDKAADALVEIATFVPLGSWNDIYTDLLLRLCQKPIVGKLERNSKFAVFNALALCLAEAEKFDQALSWISRLRSSSVRAKDEFWAGQALINLGVITHQAGDETKAITWYEKATNHARKHDDSNLLGRSLGNLAVSIVSKDPSRADALLAEAEKAKRRARDKAGLVGLLNSAGSNRSRIWKPGRCC